SRDPGAARSEFVALGPGSAAQRGPTLRQSVWDLGRAALRPGHARLLPELADLAAVVACQSFCGDVAVLDIVAQCRRVALLRRAEARARRRANLEAVAGDELHATRRRHDLRPLGAGMQRQAAVGSGEAAVQALRREPGAVAAIDQCRRRQHLVLA